MNSLSLFITFVLLSMLSQAEEINWTHRAEEGEDATSTFYYFYASDGESVGRIRSIWNGGAQNAPTVTDYIINGGEITFRHSTGNRGNIRDLLKGKEVPLKLIKEFVIKTSDDQHALTPQKQEVPLTNEQRLDLANLIFLLAKDRKPFNPAK